MADIFKAYQFLNETLDLKLSTAKLVGAEREMKAMWMKKNGFNTKTDTSKVDDWEFFAYLVPRKIKRTKKK